MDLALLTVIGIVVVALLFDYTNWFHDSANSISTIVATRVLRPRLAVLWAAFFNFIAFAFFGTKVADTVGSVVIPAYTSVAVITVVMQHGERVRLRGGRQEQVRRPDRPVARTWPRAAFPIRYEGVPASLEASVRLPRAQGRG